MQQQDKNAKNTLNSMMKPEFAGTDPQKVKKEIQTDINAGQGAMTSREAGARND